MVVTWWCQIGPIGETKIFSMAGNFLYSYWHLISKSFLEIIFYFQYITKIFLFCFFRIFNKKINHHVACETRLFGSTRNRWSGGHMAAIRSFQRWCRGVRIGCHCVYDLVRLSSRVLHNTFVCNITGELMYIIVLWNDSVFEILWYHFRFWD